MSLRCTFIYLIFEFFVIIKIVDLTVIYKDNKIWGHANIYGESCSNFESCNNPMSCIAGICRCNRFYELQYSPKAEHICIANSNFKLKFFKQLKTCQDCEGQNKFCDDNICKCDNGTVSFIDEKEFLLQQFVKLKKCVPMSNQRIFEHCEVTKKHAYVCDTRPGYNNTYCRNSKCVCLRDHFYDFEQKKCLLKTSVSNYSQYGTYKANINGYCLDKNDCVESMECNENTFKCTCPNNGLYDNTLRGCISNSHKVLKSDMVFSSSNSNGLKCSRRSDCAKGFDCVYEMCICPSVCHHESKRCICDSGVKIRMPLHIIFGVITSIVAAVVACIVAILRIYIICKANNASNDLMLREPTDNRQTPSDFDTPTTVAPPRTVHPPIAPPPPYAVDAPPTYSEATGYSFFPPPSAPNREFTLV